MKFLSGFFKTFVLVIFVGVLSFFLVGGSSSVKASFGFSGWYSGYDGYSSALAEAKETGKPMLVYFYTDW